MNRRWLFPILALAMNSYAEAQSQGMQVMSTDYIILNNTLPNTVIPNVPPSIQYYVSYTIESTGNPVRASQSFTIPSGAGIPHAVGPLPAGRLVNVSVGVKSGGVFPGANYVQVFLASQNFLTGNEPLLIAGSIQSYYTISWPNTPVKIPFNEPGWNQTLRPTPPGTGQSLTYTIPLTDPSTGCSGGCFRYRLVSVSFTMQTSTSTGLTPWVQLLDGAGSYYLASSPAAPPAGWITFHTFGAGMAASNSGGGTMTQAVPENLILTGIDGPHKIKIAWSGGVGSDVVISNIAIRVEAWNEID